MSFPTTRVLTVLELLQAHGELSGPVLAQRLEVDGRTLRRYVARLVEMGIPVVADRGRNGAYRLRPGFKLPPMMFSSDEALALSLGLLAARELGLVQVVPAVASARAKLERVMPDNLKHQVRALGEMVRIDMRASSASTGNAALVGLSSAAHGGQRVVMAYESAQKQASERKFDCYGVAWRAGNWYAVGYCHLRSGLRSFRIDRVRSVLVTDERFTPPPNFDAVQQLALGVATLPRVHAVRVLLKTDMATAQRELFSAIGLFQPLPDGILLHSQVDDLDWYARELARMPFDFEVQQPLALRRALKKAAQRLARLAGV